MLTSKAKSMLYGLYKEYKNRRYNKMSRLAAKNFGSAEHLHDSLFQSWTLSDIKDIMHELDGAGYLNHLYSSNTIYESCLTDSAIAKLDNQPKDTFLSIADFISKFIP